MSGDHLPCLTVLSLSLYDHCAQYSATVLGLVVKHCLRLLSPVCGCFARMPLSSHLCESRSSQWKIRSWDAEKPSCVAVLYSEVLQSQESVLPSPNCSADLFDNSELPALHDRVQHEATCLWDRCSHVGRALRYTLKNQTLHIHAMVFDMT